MPVKKVTAPEPTATTKTTTKKKETKTSNVVTAVPVATVVPVVTGVPVAEVESKDDVKVTERSSSEVAISDLVEKIAGLSTYMKTIQVSLKVLVKEVDKLRKVTDKVQKKKEKAKKSPSGFAKPCKISDELCDFIGIAKGTELSRTDITRHINSYVKEHNLNNPENRREFFPDKKLKSILNVKDGEKVTYFILQRLIAHHFPPSMSKLAAAAKAAAAS